MLPRRLILRPSVMEDEDEQVLDCIGVRSLHRHRDACRCDRCLGADDKASPLAWSVRIYPVRETAGRANLSKGFQPPDQPRASPASGFSARRSVAIEQNVDARIGCELHALARTRCQCPLFFWKISGTNPQFDCSGLDGAERFATKQPCSGRCSRKILQPVYSPVFEGMCGSLEVGGLGAGGAGVWDR